MRFNHCPSEFTFKYVAGTKFLYFAGGQCAINFESSFHLLIIISSVLYFLIGTVNNFVQVIIDLLSSAVICKFTEDQGNNIKSCTIIAYGPGEACDNLSSLTHGLASDTTVSSDSVVINLPVLSQSSVMEYCYVVTASNDSFTAMVKGTFSTGN